MQDQGTEPPTEAARPRFTSGRECWVCSVSCREDLPGYHAGLITDALLPDEPVHHLLYSPRVDGGRGPFGLTGLQGSHALAATPTRFVISRDPHREGERRTVLSVPFNRILSVELGHALVLGWLRIRIFAAGGALCETILFASSGIHHFQAAIRAFRSGRAQPVPASCDDPAWRECRDATPPWLSAEWPGLILEGEAPAAFLRSSERFEAKAASRGSGLVCVSPWSAAVVTERTLFLVESQRPLRPSDLVFGVNATCVDRSAIHACRIEPDSAGGGVVRGRLVAGAPSDDQVLPLEIPFDPEWIDQARGIVNSLGARGPVASP